MLTFVYRSNYLRHTLPIPYTYGMPYLSLIPTTCHTYSLYLYLGASITKHQLLSDVVTQFRVTVFIVNIVIVLPMSLGIKAN